MQTSRVLGGDDGLRTTPHGVQIEVRLPWYRSLPLSTIEVGEICIDGHKIDPVQVRFELDGRSYPLSALPDQVDHVWYVLDSAYLNVELPGLENAGRHEVSVTLHLYPPYIPGLQRIARECKSLRAS